MHNTDNKLLTITEAGRLLGISRTTAYSWAAAGRLPVVRLGPRGARVPRAALDRYLERLSEEALASMKVSP